MYVESGFRVRYLYRGIIVCVLGFFFYKIIIVFFINIYYVIIKVGIFILFFSIFILNYL